MYIIIWDYGHREISLDEFKELDEAVGQYESLMNEKHDYLALCVVLKEHDNEEAKSICEECNAENDSQDIGHVVLTSEDIEKLKYVQRCSDGSV